MRFLVLVAVTLSSSLCFAGGSLTGSYTVLPVGHPDTEENGTGVVTGLVRSTLGPDGLPVFRGSGGWGSTFINDVDPVTGEILWWTAGTRTIDGKSYTITQEKTEIDSSPIYHPTGFFPGGQPNDSNGYRAVHWSGTFDLTSPGSLTMKLGSDDDAWAFINGQLFIDNGGVHSLTTTGYSTGLLGAGVNRIDVFFVDRHSTDSGIVFDPSIDVSAAPEPCTVALAIGGAGVFLRGRTKARKA